MSNCSFYKSSHMLTARGRTVATVAGSMPAVDLCWTSHSSLSISCLPVRLTLSNIHKQAQNNLNIFKKKKKVIFDYFSTFNL